MSPLISIIIPFYNTPKKEFYRCIDSLRKQTFTEFEVVIINDGSRTECVEYLESVTYSDNRYRVIKKKNEGAAVARNIGINKAVGEYIMFLDSDDAITNFCLEEAAELVTGYHPDLIIGGVRRNSEEVMNTWEAKKNKRPRITEVKTGGMRNSLISHMIGRPEEVYNLQEGYIADGPVAKLIKKEIADKATFSEENMWNEDTIWNAEILNKCRDIIIIDSWWYKYFINSNSQTRCFRPNCPYEFFYRTKQEISLFEKIWPNCMQGIYTRAFNDITILCRTYLFHPDNPYSFKNNYATYLKCIHGDAFRGALRKIEFKEERRFLYRIVKEILRFCLCYVTHYVAYLILLIYYRLEK